VRITEIETFIVGNPWKNWMFVRVRTDEPGLYGIGEGTLNAFAKTVEAAVHELAPFVRGMDPFQTEIIMQRLVRDVYSDGGQIHKAAATAIETACWDIIGKTLGRPLYDLLGGRCHEKLRAYANGWYRGEREPEMFAGRAREVVERGYTALKFDPFGANWRTMTRREEDLSVAIVEAVRDAVGPEVDLLIEGHCRFSAAQAVAVGHRMAPFRPALFEEPVPHHNPAALVEVARHLPFPVACGESFHTLQQFAELLRHEAVQILQPEPLFLGVFATRQLAGMADAHYAVLAPHSAQGPVCSALCAQLNACTPNFYLHEIFDDFNDDATTWENRIVTDPVVVENGYITPSDRPGLGVDLNLEEMARHPYRQQNYLPLFRPGWERREGAVSNVVSE
jgi:galactonate dehydratase